MINPTLLSDSLAAKVANEVVYSRLQIATVDYVTNEITVSASKELLDISVVYVEELKRSLFFEKLFKSLTSHEREIKTMIMGIWEEERKIIISNLKKMKKAWLEKDAVDQILYPRKQFEVKIAKESKPIFESLMEERGNEELRRIRAELRKPKKQPAPVGIAFDVENPHVQRWLNTYIPYFSSNLETVSIDKLRAQLIEGMALGEGVPELIKRVNLVYDNWNKVRSEAIAQNQALRASNRGALESYRQSGVVKKKIWITHLDDRTCFPKNTKILTKFGNKNIQDIKEGDIVLTHRGWHKTKETLCREYRGRFIFLVTSDGRSLVTTEDHPIFETRKRWVQAKDLIIGDKLKSNKNQVINIIYLCNIDLFNSHDLITKVFKLLVSLSIFSNIRVPKFAINLKTYIDHWKKEINAKCPDLIFLNKINFQPIKRFSYKLFNRCFSRIFPITGKRAESPNPFVYRTNPKFFIAIKAFDIYGGAAAFFRAVFNIFSPSCKRLSTSQTDLMQDKPCLAFQTTNSIPLSYYLINRKRFFAYRTNLCNFLKLFPTFKRAKHLLSSSPVNIKFFSTLFTFLKSSSSSRFMVTLGRTVRRIHAFLHMIFRAKLFFTIFANIHNLYRYIIKLIKISQPHLVYNLEVEDAHTYFANGILVHNCLSCRKLDGKVIALEKNFFNKGDRDEVIVVGDTTQRFRNDYEDIPTPPRHNRCRCTISSFIERR